VIARVRRGTAAFVVVGMLAGGLSGCGLPRFGSRGIPDVAATVEGVDIPSTEVEALFQAFRKSASSQPAGEGQEGAVTDEVVRRTALSYQIRLVFLQSLADKYDVDITPDDSKDEIYEEFVKVQSLASEGMRPEDLKQAAEAEKISKAIAMKLAPNVDVNDSELQAAYKLREEALGESFRAQTDIAFLQEEAAANSLRDAVREGKDFKETAEGLKTESDESALLRSDSVEITPLSPIQGDLIETVRGLKKGDTSEPIRFATDDGPIWVVLHVSEREDLEALKLDDPQVRDELTKLVQDNKRYQFFDQWFNKQFREADINVDGYYGKWKKNSLAVS
jgi:hypothetical protein